MKRKPGLSGASALSHLSLALEPSVSRLARLVCDYLTGRHLGRIREQGRQMLGHERSSLEVRLLLGVLMLEDAGRNHNPVTGVDEVVSDESRHLADDGNKALIDQLYADFFNRLFPSTHSAE